MLRLNHCTDNQTTFISQNIAKSARYFTDNSMGAKHTNSVTDMGGLTPFCMSIMISRKDSLPNILISKSVDIEFASADYFQKSLYLLCSMDEGHEPVGFSNEWGGKPTQRPHPTNDPLR